MDHYNPGLVPSEYSARFYQEELWKIKMLFDVVLKGTMEEAFAAPSKLWTGRVVFADGTSWNPGSGRGPYVYDADTTTWIFLG